MLNQRRKNSKHLGGQHYRLRNLTFTMSCLEDHKKKVMWENFFLESVGTLAFKSLIFT